MGNRGVITTEDKTLGVYLHWDGSYATVEAFLAYCEMKGIRYPEDDDYGWARMVQVISNTIGGTLSIGINLYERLDTDNWNNGVYIISKWRIVGREFTHGMDVPCPCLRDYLIFINDNQPDRDRVPIEQIEDYLIFRDRM